MARQSVTEMLEQGLRFLDEVGQADYVSKNEAVYGASIGSHYRHILDHVEVLLGGLSQEDEPRLVDYDQRIRDRAVEEELPAAKAKTERLLADWKKLDERDMEDELKVASKVSYKGRSSATVKSSIGREAMYATIHAVHHFALIGVICRLRGVEMNEGFGVAPSTVAYEEKVEREQGMAKA